MSVELKMPQISEDAESGTIVEILVSEGDTIEEEQSIIAVESDKASVEVPAESGGKVKEIKVEEGDEVEIGDVIMILEENGEAADEKEAEDSSEDEQAEAEEKEEDEKEDEAEKEEDEVEDEEDDKGKQEKVAAEDQQDDKEKKKSSDKKDKNGEVPAAPSVRRLARELNVDIYAVKGSGLGERITADDVKAAAEDGQAE